MEGVLLICFSGHMPFGLSISAQGLYYVALHSALLQGSKLTTTTLQPLDGLALSARTLSIDTDVSNADSILSLETTPLSSLLVWCDRTKNDLRVNILGTSQILATKLSNEKGRRTETLQIHASATKQGAVDVLVHCKSATSHWAVVFQLDIRSETLRKTYQLPGVEGAAAFSVAVHDGDTYLIRTTKRDVTLFSTTSDHHREKWLFQPKDHNRLRDDNDIAFAVSELVTRGRASYAVRSAVLLSSGDWRMIHNGEESWFRPESLSGVVAAAWAEVDGHEGLADELAAESHSSVGAAYVHRIKRHARDAKNFPKLIQGLSDRLARSLLGTENRSQDKSLSKNSFGFNKIIIAATDSGRLFAIDLGSNGEILWSIKASVMEPGQHWAVESIEVSRDIALVRLPRGEKLQVSIANGVIMDDQLSSAETGLKTIVTVSDTLGSAVAIEVKADGTVTVTPRRHWTQDTVIVTQDDKMVIRGWTAGTPEPLLAWTFVPQPNEKIVRVAARPLNDPVAAIGKALGDRNVLYKFLSPNLLVIGALNVDTSSASFYVLDPVSGQVLHTLSHRGVDATQPIACFLSENWIAYTVFSNFTEGGIQNAATPAATAKGYQLVISELFESPIANDRGASNPALKSSNLHPGPMDAGVHNSGPYVVSQTYLLPAAVSFMTVTSTLQGITPRSLLCVVPSLNSVFAVPRAIIDPRRPTGRDATSVEVEEGLFRHEAALDFDPKWALNHMREVWGIQKVITSPSLLESTSLVFAFGNLDMFGTRVAPIGGFDMLGKEFSKIQLLGTVAALAVGTGLLAPLVSSTTCRFLCWQETD